MTRKKMRYEPAATLPRAVFSCYLLLISPDDRKYRPNVLRRHVAIMVDDVSKHVTLLAQAFDLLNLEDEAEHATQHQHQYHHNLRS